MEEGREKAMTSNRGGGDDDFAAKTGNGFLPAPSSLHGGGHAQGGDILISASTNWCESGDRPGGELM